MFNRAFKDLPNLHVKLGSKFFKIRPEQVRDGSNTVERKISVRGIQLNDVLKKIFQCIVHEILHKRLINVFDNEKGEACTKPVGQWLRVNLIDQLIRAQLVSAVKIFSKMLRKKTSVVSNDQFSSHVSPAALVA